MADRKKSRRRRGAGGQIASAPPAGVSTTAIVAAPVREAPAPDAPQPIVIHPGLHGELDAGGEAAAVLQTLPVIQVRPDAPAGVAAGEMAVAGTTAGRRATSLDALRGLFLIAMTVGFTVRGDLLPQWMYHRQAPPPDFAVADIAGISWRDLTYVAFLFTMAAALPLTLSRRVDRGETEIAIVAGAVRRFALLLVFALLIGHSNTFFTGYTQTARAIAVAGFVVMALLFTRPKSSWDSALWKRLRTAGWILAFAFLALTPLLYGSTFAVTRLDEVIAGLAFASLAGSVVWYFTRDNLIARLGVLAGVVALYLGARNPGWVQQWWWSSPVPWAIAPSKLSLLAIVIPGTIAGDAILRWVRARDDDGDGRAGWGSVQTTLVASLGAAFAPVVTVGMYNRASLLTTQIVLGMVGAGLLLTAQPVRSVEKTLRSLFVWGSAWLLIGLWMEPFEGGMRKVPETLSYFFAVTGVSVMLLVALTALIDALQRRRWAGVLVDVGQNPMLCYVLYTVLLNSIFELVPPLRDVLRASVWEIVLRMMLETAVVIVAVRFFSQRRIYWRT